MTGVVRALLTVGIAFASGCGAPTPATSGPPTVDLPVTDGLPRSKRGAKTAARPSPPPSSGMRDAAFPVVARTKLANGMGLDVVSEGTLPLVWARMLVRVGVGVGPPGVGMITAAMLREGGASTMPAAEVMRRVESLGADLEVSASSDGTVVEMAFTRDRLEEGIGLLASIVREPRFEPAELKTLVSRLNDDTMEHARSSGPWAAAWIVMHELYRDRHPYRSMVALPSQTAKVDAAKLRDFYRRFYVPKASTLILVGDVDAATARDVTQRQFGTWSGPEPSRFDVAPEAAIDHTRVIVAHRPRSTRSEVYVVTLAPERKAEDWAPARVAIEVLASRASTRIDERAHDRQPVWVTAEADTVKTSETVRALLDTLARMATSAPSPEETERARHVLDDEFAIRTATPKAVAERISQEEILGLGEGAFDGYRKRLRAIEPAEAAAMATRLFSADHPVLVVVAGDADAIGPSLTRFGDVTVVDPEKEFAPLRTLPRSVRP